MPVPDPSLQLWLPALAHFEPAHPLRAWLARADRLPDGSTGYLGGLGDYFRGVDAGVPAAAITRQLLAGDAADQLWLLADPAWVEPDMNGVRLLACGRMGLDMDAAQALAEPLRPVFDEAGMQLEIATPDHWHLRLPPDTPLPDFAAPEQALGEDLAQHLPQGAQGRRWRVLLNDVQVLLHQHPLNTRRRAHGQSPVNSLWLWGGGRLPPPSMSELAGVVSDDLLLHALAARAGVAWQSRTAEAIAAGAAGWLIDLQDLPAHELALRWWPLLQPLLERRAVRLHFASGERWQRKPWHRWRYWRGAGR
ncbi:phosphoglycerate mutase [Rhodanobacter sp. B2A1Ga4]|uniref:phosphoglycerate mutase n=1 Tax=Rhodanobacter sp. B2A1Ga4 TaxID=2778647 RepID=UPI001B35CD2C|nr:phosphoglycerate mutase [Rhodanobacter sp. B2A1Ga4]MBQ4853569.1 phosphoglycerate mutase [Rhodanobacter sp. B2A1Ga4]